MATSNGTATLNGTGPLNGWARIFGVIGIPGAIAFYLVWWVTQSLGARLDRIPAPGPERARGEGARIMTGRGHDDMRWRPAARRRGEALALGASPSVPGARSPVTGSDGSTAAPLLDDGALPPAAATVDPSWSEAIRTFKRDLLEQTLERTHGNRTHAARALGLQRTYLLKLIHELGVRAAPVRPGPWSAPAPSPSPAAR